MATDWAANNPAASNRANCRRPQQKRARTQAQFGAGGLRTSGLDYDALARSPGGHQSDIEALYWGVIMVKSSEGAAVLENIVLGIPRIAKAMEDLPIEELWPALEAVEGSYRATLRQSGFSISVSTTLAATIIRRLKGQLAGDEFAATEVMQRLCEDLAVFANGAAA